MVASQKKHKRPRIKKSILKERELCPDCYKVIGAASRYKLLRLLAHAKNGLNVNALTKHLKLRQPTVTHHLQVLFNLDAVMREVRGRERIYTLNRGAHCFEECKIPF